jgi:uncharacterized protein HemX
MMSREQFITELRNSKYADLAKNSLRLVILEQNQEIKSLERQLKEARELLLQIQDHMSQLSTHTHDGWSGSCADTVYEMIEEQLKEQG